MPVTINGSGPIAGVTSINTTVSDTELGYLDGVTSALQTQINAKAADSSQGLYLITPSSIANSGGSASASGGAISFTTVNSVSLNGCFTATYDNYRILLNYSGSASDYLSIRLRASGSDLSTTTYAFQMVQGASTTVSGSRTTGQTAWGDIIYFDATQESAAIDIYNPALAKATYFHLLESRSTPVVRMGAGNNSTASAYDGMTIYPTSGTITGTVRVYGYKN